MTPISRRLLTFAAGIAASSLVVSGLVAGATAATALPSVSASASIDAAPPPIPRRYLDQPFRLTGLCSFDDSVRAKVRTANPTYCAFVKVPMDWRHPDAHRNIRLAIAYTKATKTSKGLLTSNPGGPGVPGLDLTVALALDKHQMFSDYDLLGFDPRGFGDSQNVDCSIDDAAAGRLPTTVDYRSRSRKTHDAEVAEAKFYGRACSSSELSQFINTQQTTFDLDFLRELLNRRLPNRVGKFGKLNYIGYSYGTWLGAWYADTYPSRVGRFILDSNMNWTGSMYANQRTDSFSFQRRRDQMFYPWLARHDSSYHYGKTAATVKAHYEKSRAKLVSFARQGYDVPAPQDVDFAIADSMYVNADFYTAVDYLLQLDDIVKYATPPDIRRAGLALERSLRTLASGSAGVDTGQIVRCNDTQYPTDVHAILTRADLDAKNYPFIGYLDTVTMCSYWRFRAKPRTIDLAGVPRMLMIQTEGDPATAYEGALAAHEKTSKHTRLVSVENEGQHAIYIGGPSRCVDRTGDAFLFSGKLPAKDTACTTSPLPGDSKVYSLKGPLNAKRYSLDVGVRPLAPASPNPLLTKIRTAAAQRSIG